MKQICRVVLGVLFLSVFILGGAAPVSAAVEPDGSVVINEVNFPDEGLRTYISSFYVDNNQNGVLEQGEREEITHMEIGYSNTSEEWESGIKYSCRGIEYFPNIQSLSINEFECLQERIEGLPRLERLSIWDVRWSKKLAMQELSQKVPLSQLKELELVNCDMSELNLAQAKRLEKLSVSHGDDTTGARYDHITEGITHVGVINLRKNKELKTLNLEALDLKKLDLSQNKKLEEIQIKDMKIPKGVKLSDFAELRKVSILNTGNLQSLDLSRSKNLAELRLTRMEKLTKLNLSKNRKLEKLELVGGAVLKSLILPKKGNLKELEVSGAGKLKKLDLSQNRKLKILSLHGLVSLKKLDVKENKRLKELNLTKRGPKMLDLTGNLQLKKMYLEYPKIRFKLAKKNRLEEIGLHASYVKIDLSTCTTSLKRILNEPYGCGAKVRMKRSVFEKLWNSGKLMIGGYGDEWYTNVNKKISIPKKGKYIYIPI